VQPPRGVFLLPADGGEADPPLEILSLEELEKRWRAIAAE